MKIQKTEGHHSPIIEGNNNTVILNRYKPVQEVKSMMGLISLITERAQESKGKDFPSEKDLKKKLEVRFSQYQKELSDSYKELLPSYGEIYEEAISQSEITEVQANQNAIYLRWQSKKALEEEKNNPINALNTLTKYFQEQLEITGEHEFSNGAVRFFLYQELIKCNVFPNPLND